MIDPAALVDKLVALLPDTPGALAGNPARECSEMLSARTSNAAITLTSLGALQFADLPVLGVFLTWITAS